MKRTAKKQKLKSKLNKQGQVNLVIDNGNGWVKLKRGELVETIIIRSKNAFALLTMIALRAWRGPGKNGASCGPNEAQIGDWEKLAFTRKEYRVSLKILVDLGLIEVRATNKGTICKLLTTDIFDINADESRVTERTEGPAKGQQGANEGPSKGQPGANEGQAGGHPGATNKNLRSKEGKNSEEVKSNNTNNVPADAGGAGGNPPPIGGNGAVAPGNLPEAEEYAVTPQQKATRLGNKLPTCAKILGKLNHLPVFTATTSREALEYFERNTTYEVFDVTAICILGMKFARENAAPEEGVDPYFYARRFAHKPNRIFTRNADGDLILSCIENEVKYRPDDDHSEDWAADLFASEFAKADRNEL